MRERTLLALTAVTAIALTLSARGAIDFHRHWRIAEADRIFNRKDYAEAQAEFEDLADSTSDPAEHAILAARAAIARGHQDGQYKSALEDVAQIRNQPVADHAIAALLASRKDWSVIVERFGDAPIADWPVVQLPGPIGKQDIRIDVLLTRADAFTRTGAFQQAERDLEQAADMCSDWRRRIRILRDLANLRQRHLNDADGAYEANMQIVTGGRGGAICYVAAMNAADHLLRNGRRDEAVAMVESINPRDIQNVGWRGRVMIEWGRLLRKVGRPADAGDIFQEVVASSMDYAPEHRRTAALEAAATLAAAGRDSEAIAAYRRLLAMPGITDAQREQAETALRQDQRDGP